MACVQVTFAEEADCQWQWYRSAQQLASAALSDSKPADAAQNSSNSSSEWQELPDATERLYRPKQQDVGRKLRVKCTPAR